MGPRVAVVVGVLAAGLLAGGCAVVSPPGLELVGGIHGTYTIGGPPMSVESWTAEPTEPDPAFLETAIAECVPFARRPDATQAIQDQRGPDGAAFLFRGDQEAECLVVRGLDGVPTVVGATWSSAPVGPTRPPLVNTFVQGDVSAATGWVGEGTALVELETAGGVTLRATVDAERFVAWWPGPEPIRWVRWYRADGTPGTVFELPAEERTLVGSTGRLDFVSPGPSPR
jgi:hypothetical protein